MVVTLGIVVVFDVFAEHKAVYDTAFTFVGGGIGGTGAGVVSLYLHVCAVGLIVLES